MKVALENSTFVPVHWELAFTIIVCLRKPYRTLRSSHFIRPAILERDRKIDNSDVPRIDSVREQKQFS